MGRKVHPMGFRIGIIRDWQAKWYADKQYVGFLQEDLKLRQAIQSKYAEAGISQVQIERQANEVFMTIHTARPGIVIGRGGQRVDEIRLYLENLIGKKVRLNIQEIRQPELDAYLVARVIAEQIERRVAYRRAMKQAIFRTTQAGAKGIRVRCAGRLGGAEIARCQMMHQGQVPLHTLRADIDYGLTEARTTLGRIGIKVWIYKGDILPEPKVTEVEEMPAEEVVSEVAAEEVVASESMAEAVASEVAAEEVVASESTAKTVASKSSEAEPPATTKRKKTVTATKSSEAEPPATTKRKKTVTAAKSLEAEPPATTKRKKTVTAAKSLEAEPPATEKEETDVTTEAG